MKNELVQKTEDSNSNHNAKLNEVKASFSKKNNAIWAELDTIKSRIANLESSFKVHSKEDALSNAFPVVASNLEDKIVHSSIDKIEMHIHRNVIDIRGLTKEYEDVITKTNKFLEDNFKLKKCILKAELVAKMWQN